MPDFEDVYIVKAGDTLSTIARSRGYQNPGPVFAYPANRAMFPNRAAADKIKPGQRIRIPWHPHLLQKIIVTSQALIEDTTETTKRLIEEQVHDAEVLEEYLRKIDAINMIAQVHVSIGALTAESMEHGGVLSSRQIAEWLADSRVHLFAGDLAPLVIPAPTAPKMDFKFFVRHTLGPWTPAFWTSVYAAIKEGDVDLYLYGADAVTHRTLMRIKRQADSDLQRLDTTIKAARHQLTMSFYQTVL